LIFHTKVLELPKIEGRSRYVMRKNLGGVILLPLLLTFLVGCPGEDEVTMDDVLIIGDGTNTTIDPVDPDTIVCNPLDDDPDAPDLVTSGLRGDLYYREDGQPRYYSAQDYIDNATHFEDLTMFFSHLDIPTRPFDRGFVTEGGYTLTTEAGDTLYEYFALDLYSRLKLASEDADGLYEIAVISDDGSVLEFDWGSGFETYIDNDGDHPTRMGCAAEPLAMTSTTAIPLRLKYYQGPRYHIALVVMYRPYSEEEGSDAFCGVSGNNFYFDSTKDPVEPTSNYQALLDRGWKVMNHSNYLLPEPGERNPCVEPDAPDPEVTDINVGLIDRTSVIINWTTNTATTSQLRVTNVSNGQTMLYPLDPAYLTEHSMAANGLSANTTYQFVAISVDVEGRIVESPTVQVRTRR